MKCKELPKPNRTIAGRFRPVRGVGFVADADGEAQVADAHLVDAQLAVVTLLLDVGQRAGFINVHFAWET